MKSVLAALLVLLLFFVLLLQVPVHVITRHGSAPPDTVTYNVVVGTLAK